MATMVGGLGRFITQVIPNLSQHPHHKDSDVDVEVNAIRSLI